MDLAKIVIDKIEELGITPAAGFFGVSVPTIYAWKKKGSPPIEAVQRVLDSQPVTGINAPVVDIEGSVVTTGQVTIPEEMPTAPEGGEPQEVAGDTPATSVFSATFMKETNNRLSNIEDAIAAITDPARKIPLTSGIQPFKNRESGMAIKNRAEIISDPRSHSSKPGWNKPVREGTQREGWNAPVQETREKNKPGAWNKPVSE